MEAVIGTSLYHALVAFGVIVFVVIVVAVKAIWSPIDSEYKDLDKK